MLGKPKEEGLEFEARSPCIVRPHVNKQIKTKGLACNSESESVLKDLILHGRNKRGWSPSPSPPPPPFHNNDKYSTLFSAGNSEALCI